MKRLATCAVLSLLFAGLSSVIASSIAIAGPKPAACKPTKAMAHNPSVVPPPKKIAKSFPRTFTLKTNCGDIVITTVGASAPITLTAFSTLTRGGYFDGTLCHRLTTEGFYVLQCGDPTASGSGGPGWNPYPDENLPQQVNNNYPEGTVAMANSGPNTNGSQFFLVYADTTLGAKYTIWGNITSGLEILKAIAVGGVKPGGRSPSDGTPKKTIAIEKMKISN